MGTPDTLLQYHPLAFSIADLMAQHELAHAEIVGIGVSVLDLVMVIDDLPEEEGVLEAIDRYSGLGGGVSVAIDTAASLGVPTALLDCLGTDGVSDSIVSTLHHAGVNVELIDRNDKFSASLATVWVKQSTGSRTIVFSPGKYCDNKPLDFRLFRRICG